MKKITFKNFLISLSCFAIIVATSFCFVNLNFKKSVKAESYISFYSTKQKPIFYGATEITIDKNVTENFNIYDSRFRIFAKDFEDGDLTPNIQCVYNNVNSTTAGDYVLKYRVTDSHNNTSEIEVPVHILDSENGECKIIRSLYTIPALNNMKTISTERCNNGDRQILGIYLPADATADIKVVDADKDMQITFFTNTKNKNSFNSIKSSSTENQTIKNVVSGVSYDSVPLITSPRLDSENDLNRIFKIEIKFDSTAKALDYYHYKDSEENFKTEWKKSENSFGVVDGEAIMCVVPFMDVDKLSGYIASGYNSPFVSLDAFFEYYLEVVNRMDKMIGLEFDSTTALDQNFRTKYTAVADSTSSAGAYYAGNYIAVCQQTIAPIFQYGWGTLHEIAHGYQGYLGKGANDLGSLYLNETGNNILAHYINIDETLYKKSDRRLGNLQTCEDYYNNFRKTTTNENKTIFHNNDGTYTNCNEKLYAIVNLLDAFEGSKTYGKLFSYYRKLVSVTGLHGYLIQDVYAKFFAEEYNANIIPYLEAWTISVSETTKQNILNMGLNSYSITSDVVSNDNLNNVLTGENLRLKYGLISENSLTKYNLKSNLTLNIDIENFDLIKNKNIGIYNKNKLIKTIKIDSNKIEIANLNTANYEIKLPVILGYSNKICSAFLVSGDNEINYTYSKLQTKNYTNNLTTIKILGIYSTVGYAMQFDNNYKLANITHGGADLGNRNEDWENLPDKTFASVEVLDADGNQIYIIEVKGNNYFSNYTATSPITLDEGYTIKIYTQKPQLIKVYANSTNLQLTDYNLSNYTNVNTLSYKITANGLKFLNVDEFDEQQVLYNHNKTVINNLIDNYIENVDDEKIFNTRIDPQTKYDIICAYNQLNEEDKTNYTSFVNNLSKGGSPEIIGKEKVTTSQYKDVDLYSLISIIDNEDFVIESNSENVKIETNLNLNKAGEYVVTYLVADSDGNVTTKEILIKVYPSPILILTIIVSVILLPVGMVLIIKFVSKKQSKKYN